MNKPFIPKTGIEFYLFINAFCLFFIKHGGKLNTHRKIFEEKETLRPIGQRRINRSHAFFSFSPCCFFTCKSLGVPDAQTLYFASSSANSGSSLSVGSSACMAGDL